MIFTADLDRTLIFSPKRLLGGAPVIPVEYRQGEACGFMRPGALAALELLGRRGTLLINTLRGLEQARRVSFVTGSACRYLSIQNGLYLYRDGVPDWEWSRRVSRAVDALPLDLEGAAALVRRQVKGILQLSRQYEFLAVFFVEPQAFCETAYGRTRRELAGQGWDLYRQGRKLYISPLAIDKGAAVRRVQELEGDRDVVGFGDSYFDIPMLRACGAAFSLAGSELAETGCPFPVSFSSAPAEAGTEEILNRILRHLN